MRPLDFGRPGKVTEEFDTLISTTSIPMTFSNDLTDKITEVMSTLTFVKTDGRLIYKLKTENFKADEKLASNSEKNNEITALIIAVSVCCAGLIITTICKFHTNYINLN